MNTKKEIKLERLKKKAKNLKSILNTESDIKKSFYGGMVGFKKGAARRKHESSINKELNQYNELKEIEKKIDRLENPLIRSKTILINPNTLILGQKKYWFGVLVKIVKINKKTVTVETDCGYTEAIKPHLLD